MPYTRGLGQETNKTLSQLHHRAGWLLAAGVKAGTNRNPGNVMTRRHTARNPMPRSVLKHLQEWQKPDAMAKPELLIK